ncbi:aminotransferase-like domain-containing protein [Thalassotalea eurytherma]|uniref:GntR family transcriptional regulator n=1 Tax=Thalassotalea eurytherma TaxID=1144278 RepID=A0ABQ6GZV4_9GAMM|nr:PLP-dependent aminotransferase family protein [Thalassotalea eurytherma]GLX81435.1 GntR family transcriptional regulator [Thalassotalea eurytherma]
MTKLYLQLSYQIEQQIDENLILPSEKLPSIRTIMASHGVAKNTVISALNDLEKKGIIFAKAKVGFFVSPRRNTQHQLPNQHFPNLESQAVSLTDIFYDVMNKEAAFDIVPNDSTALPSQHLISLNKHIRRAYRQQIPFRSSHYDTPKGHVTLREQLSHRYRLRGINIDVESFCITSGCQHSLMLALMATCKQGDTVAVETPTFYGSLLLLEQLKLNVVEVSSHPVTGLDIEHLTQALEKTQITACIVTPNFATPTGSLMPEDNKNRLLSLANDCDFAVIEDDIYGEISFADPTSSLLSFDTQERVIVCSSMSKALSKDIRIGWIIGSRWQKQIEQLKLTSILACSSSIQSGVAEFMASGDYRKHINYTQHTLQQQMLTLTQLLTDYWPSCTRFTKPLGGISLWVELAHPINSLAIYHKLLKDNIVITPGLLFSHRSNYQHCIRLSFQHAFNKKRVEAIKTIGKTITASL